jgi:D-cysteine desulfhydrase family pyridoxal phosphate-dependent enzyme
MASNTSTGCSQQGLMKRFDFTLPSWAQNAFKCVPEQRLHLGNFPTPMYRLLPTKQSETLGSRSVLKRLEDMDISLYVKRDDMSGGLETGGNKIRKLEFLLADALAKGKQSVITIGGEQSNHCRATAAACRMLGLEPHLILRTTRADDIQSKKDEIGYIGNILFDRMVGSTIYCCTPGEYGRLGSQKIVDRLARYLEENDPEQRGEPYQIPVGGSNGLGTFGYLIAVEEILSQWKDVDQQPPLDHVVFACGSGGTACGLALGMALAHGAFAENDSSPSRPAPIVHAIGVCDSPDYFYSFCARIADQMGLKLPDGVSTESFIRSNMIAHMGRGIGYAQSTQEELDFISDFALETGIVLDPVYSGKAMYYFIKEVLMGDPESFRGKTVLFVHTGGALGIFDKGEDLLSTLSQIAPAKRLDIYGKKLENGVDISNDIN